MIIDRPLHDEVSLHGGPYATWSEARVAPIHNRVGHFCTARQDCCLHHQFTRAYVVSIAPFSLAAIRKGHLFPKRKGTELLQVESFIRPTVIFIAITPRHTHTHTSPSTFHSTWLLHVLFCFSFKATAASALASSSDGGWSVTLLFYRVGVRTKKKTHLQASSPSPLSSERDASHPPLWKMPWINNSNNISNHATPSTMMSLSSTTAPATAADYRRRHLRPTPQPTRAAVHARGSRRPPRRPRRSSNTS